MHFQNLDQEHVTNQPSIVKKKPASMTKAGGPNSSLYSITRPVNEQNDIKNRDPLITPCSDGSDQQQHLHC
jgi:hypothetical protein